MNDHATFPLILSHEALRGDADPNWLFDSQISLMFKNGFGVGNLPTEMRALYCLGHYLGNVNNGGHSQFVGNANKFSDGGAARMLDWAFDAAKWLDLHETIPVMEEMRAWISANPETVATQTGFTGGRAPELDILDKQLRSADKVDRDAWLNEAATFGPELAPKLPKVFGIDSKYHTWPTQLSLLRQMRFLLTGMAFETIEGSQWQAHVTNRLKHDAFASAVRMKDHLADLDNRLPKHGSASALHIAFLTQVWDAIAPDAFMTPETHKPIKKGQQAVFSIIATPPEKRLLVAELINGMTTLSWATGSAHNPADQMSSDDEATSRLGAIWKYLTSPSWRSNQRSLAAFRARFELRKVEQIGQAQSDVGNAIVNLMHRCRLRQALAQDIEDHGTAKIQGWRLDEMRLDHTPRLEWQFYLRDKSSLQVIATPDLVMIRQDDDPNVRNYRVADLKEIADT